MKYDTATKTYILDLYQIHSISHEKKCGFQNNDQKLDFTSMYMYMYMYVGIHTASIYLFI